MTIEFARAQTIERPWGVAEGATEAGHWLKCGQAGSKIGEIWYERTADSAPRPALLLKLLLTSQPLSIQVHPDDAYARTKGLANGKTEAWYVLEATQGAKVAVGLKGEMPLSRLRQAAEDGSITDLLSWKNVAAGDAILVPAGTIHAIGAGVVIAEIQQRSDATYRLFDHGSKRELHLDDALAVSRPGPAATPPRPQPIDRERTLLVSSPYFVMERLELAPDSVRCLAAELETWVLVISGGGNAGSHVVASGDGLFVQSDRVDIHAGPHGLVALAAYTGDRHVQHLLQPVDRSDPSKIAPLQPFGEQADAGPYSAVRYTGL